MTVWWVKDLLKATTTCLLTVLNLPNELGVGIHAERFVMNRSSDMLGHLRHGVARARRCLELHRTLVNEAEPKHREVLHLVLVERARAFLIPVAAGCGAPRSTLPELKSIAGSGVSSESFTRGVHCA